MSALRTGAAAHCRTAALLIAVCFSASAALAEPTPQQRLYWWQDELREAAAELATAISGHVAQWPQIAVDAGSAVMPLPAAAGEIVCDGRLDEPAWAQATTFPLGPIFDDWRAGPLTLSLSACRDKDKLYLAIRSERDLAELGSLTPEAGLFTAGKTAYRLGPGGNIAAENCGRDGSTTVIELCLPLAGNNGLTFSVENLRYQNGKLPPETAWLGLDQAAASGNPGDHRKGALWLKPISVELVPAEIAAALAWSQAEDGGMILAGRLIGGDGRATPIEPLKMNFADERHVAPFAWTTDRGGRQFSLRGFCYREPMPGGPARAAAREAAGAVETGSPQVRAERRGAYCRLREARARELLSLLDAPLLFLKRHPYFAAHIYDDYYTWHPGGGIYVRNKPDDPSRLRDVRPVIDAATNETLGAGVYRDPNLSWDASELVFAYRPDPQSTTSIYTIRVDGTGLKRLTASQSHHDVTPAWLPDGRIVFTSTRPRALVPCFNSGVSTLHTMRADGSEIVSISANNVTEFDPAVMHDGRVLYGRWEYVDKTALYLQSLWTVAPDGRMEEALFANNLAKPTAILDARPVPDSHCVVASLTPHNGQSVGAIGMIDTRLGKNDLKAVTNFTPEYPIEMDQGLRTGPCDPWPLSKDTVLISNNAIGSHGIIELVDRSGRRELVHCDEEISCYAPMLVKPRKTPLVVNPLATAETTGRFLLTDIYQGLDGIGRGTVKKLRIVEETARTSGIPPGGRWWNQAFLISWQGAYIVKNILGTVPVFEDGSAWFEAPAGRAIYFEALDQDGREVQRMRTFVQARAGTTRSCIGCHEGKKTAPVQGARPPLAILAGPPSRPEPESWGSGYVDYPTMVQPILDRHCVRCHGGEEGMGQGLDFSGGWTWAFNIGYETLIKHRLTGFLNCNNASVHTAEILPAKTIGSGAAHLAEVILKKHPEVTRAERELIFAWMDTNSNYYGTWDYTPYATCDAILQTQGPLAAVMKAAGCTGCHAPNHVGSDWINLQMPEWSRILRAPMAKTKGGLGLEFCRAKKARQGYPLVTQAVQPPDVFLPSLAPEWDPSGEPVITFASAEDPHYEAMLDIIRQAQAEALARPRVDMPGAEIEPGVCRMQVAIPLPDAPPDLTAAVRGDGAVELAWQRTAATIGLQYEIHRGSSPDFAPSDATQIGLTTAGRFLDLDPPQGRQQYALRVSTGEAQSRPVWATVDVPPPEAPDKPIGLAAQPRPGEVRLAWRHPMPVGVSYNVYRQPSAGGERQRLNPQPLAQLTFLDRSADDKATYAYVVRAVSRRGKESQPSETVRAAPLPLVREPVFTLDAAAGLEAALLDNGRAKGSLLRGARVAGGAVEFGSAGFATFAHRPELDVPKAFSIECWVRIDRESRMPVILCCGQFNQSGWFLQRYGSGWRWHLAPTNCDGGRPAVGRWTHLVGTYDGSQARLYQDGKQVAAVVCQVEPAPAGQPLILGQYASNQPDYQVDGALAGLMIYHRALAAEEVAEKAARTP